MKDFFKTNSYYEGLIQNLLGGSKGCFSVFMHFFYQYNQSRVFFDDWAPCFKTLFEKELENCQILSELILKLGGDNKYFSSSRKFLSGNNIEYLKNSSKIFLLDVELLEIGVLETKSLINKIEDDDIRFFLNLILKNKKQELKILKENYFKIQK